MTPTPEPQWLLDLRVVAVGLMNDVPIEKSAKAIATTLQDIASRAALSERTDRTRLEAAEKDDGGLDAVSRLAGRLYKNVKGLSNEGVGHITLAFTEKDGTRGAVIVLAPDLGNEEILRAVETIYDRQDAALAGEKPNDPDRDWTPTDEGDK